MEDNIEMIKKWNEKLRERYLNIKNSSKQKKQTNADRIRSMTDEELAVFLCKVKADYQWITQDFPREDECGEWEIWLQSEVEGVTENELS